MKEHHIIGMMSGTSLDGLDLAHCTFSKGSRWSYRINAAETVPYDARLKAAIENVYGGSALDLVKTDHQLGDWFGLQVKKFMEKNHLQADMVASHGQTIFHQPGNGFTCQLGNGWEIAKHCQVPVVNDFRSLDVAFGGQGAPLVPIGDQLLFHEFEYCLNLGGFSNISYQHAGQRIAFDVCAVNMVLNHLALRLGSPYDENGQISRGGNLLHGLLEKLNALRFYQQSPPKSLGFEWVAQNILPLLESTYKPADLLNTYCHHIAMQIDKVLRGHANQSKENKSKMLVTGGGAFNDFLLSLFHQYSGDIASVEVPGPQLVNFKEALVFAFLGMLRWRGEINILSSVTGGGKDFSSGVIYEIEPATQIKL